MSFFMEFLSKSREGVDVYLRTLLKSQLVFSPKVRKAKFLFPIMSRAATIHFPTIRYIYRYKGHDTIHYCARQN